MRRYAAVTTALAVTVPFASAHEAAEPYAAPAALPGLSAAALDARYAAVRLDVERAHTTAVRVHDTGRARALADLLKPGRRFLSFDARGDGRVVEVLGDLGAADRVAVVVPGADGKITNFDSVKWAGGGSRALADQARRAAPGTRLAVVAWLGYASPSTLSPVVLTAGRADDAAGELRRLVTGVRAVNAHAPVSLLCHSYGSVVCGRAAERLPVNDIALFGSPGTTARTAADLKTPGRVWAGRASGDWMRFVPKARFAGVGFGADPVSPAFGATRFDAGSGRHSGYLTPGTASVRNLAEIALGRDAAVSRG